MKTFKRVTVLKGIWPNNPGDKFGEQKIEFLIDWEEFDVGDHGYMILLPYGFSIGSSPHAPEYDPVKLIEGVDFKFI